MSKSNYQKLDETIVSCIRNGADTIGALMGNKKVDAAYALSPAPPGRLYRTLDRRLQSLRKRGLIEYVNGRWHIKVEDR